MNFRSAAGMLATALLAVALLSPISGLPEGESKTRSTSGKSQQAGREAAASQPDIPAHAAHFDGPACFGGNGASPALEEIAAGRFHNELYLLEPGARNSALEKLADSKVPRHDVASLRVDKRGHIFYACSVPGPETRETTASATLSGTSIAETSLATTLPILHSRPGSQRVIFLDFEGSAVSGTQWNLPDNGRGAVASYSCVPYDTDGDAASFSGTEQNDIYTIYEMVAEDFIPFDVDVTTERPETFNNQTIHVLITRSKDAAGIDNPSSDAAGAAYFDVFGQPNLSYYSPAFVYFDKVGSAADIAQVCSHEVGHNLGLSHDGTTGAEYYPGHGSGDLSWGPIMGAPFGRNVTQWSKGEYYLANNLQDDLAIIAARLTYVDDDHSDTIASAAPAEVNGNYISGNGIIGKPGDSDFFKISTVADGSINLFVTPMAWPSGAANLDVVVRLYNSAGDLLLTSDPSDTRFAFLNGWVPAGDLYLQIAPAGTGTPIASNPSGYTAYGSLGTYYFSGSADNLAPVAPGFVAAAEDVSVLTDETAVFSVWATGNPSPTYQWQRRLAGASTWQNLTDDGIYSGTATSYLQVDETIYAMTGDQFRCVVTNSVGSVTSRAATLMVSGRPGFTLRPLTKTVIVGASVTFSASASSADSVHYQWRHNGVDIPGATSEVFSIGAATLSDGGDYEVVASNLEGSSVSIFKLHVAPDHLAVSEWGANDDGQISIPSGLGSLFDAKAGGSHTIALKQDGTVRAWGRTFYGATAVPEGLANVVAVAAGGSHGLALKNDGTVVGWGDAPWSGTGPGALPPSTLNQVIDISAGWGCGGAVRANGRVVTWGFGDNEFPKTLRDIAQIAVGPFHYLALKRDGTVIGWGENFHGEATPPDGLTNVIAIAAGGSASGGHSLALRADGTVVAWGYNIYGQCNVPSGLNNVVAIAAGGHFSTVLKVDGSIVAFGQNDQGQLNLPTGLAPASGVSAGFAFGAALIVATPPAIAVSPSNRTINLHNDTTFTVVATGTPPFSYLWKKDGVDLNDSATISGAHSSSLILSDAELGDAGSYTVDVINSGGSVTSAPAILRVAVPTPFAAHPLSRAATEGDSVSFSVTMDGAGPFLYEWKHNRQSIPGQAGPSLTINSSGAQDAGFYEAIVTNSDGGVSRTVFYLSVGLSNPTITVWGDYANPPPPINGSIVAVQQKGQNLALKGDGSVVAWDAGGLVTLPPEVADIVSISSAESHTVGLRADGTVVDWVAHDWTDPVPTRPPAGLRDVVAVAAGYSHDVALKSDGTVVSWGDSSTAEVPAGLKDVVAIAAGTRYTLALKTDGSIARWGYYNLGIVDVPSQVTDVVGIAADQSYALATKRDGTLVGWGSSFFGTLNIPPGVSNVIATAVDTFHSMALKADGTVVAWGDDSTHDVTVPPELSGVVAISSGFGRSMALTRTTAPAILAPPESRTVVQGDYVEFKIEAQGALPVTYQWRHGGVPLAEGAGVVGVHSALLAIENAQATDQGGYDVVITNSAGTITSPTASLSVQIPPAFVQRPLSQAALVGQSLTIDAVAAGVGPITYQWRRNGQVISGATGSSLTIKHVSLNDEGYYEVIASNSSASAHSVFSLRVAPGNPTMKVIGWGDGGYGALGPSNVPQGLINVVDMAAGMYHAVALTSDGKLRAWGVNNFGPTTIPADLGSVAAVAAGAYHTLALTLDGRVHSWGNYFDQPAPVPVSLRNVVAISAKGTTNIALKSDGTVVCWGISGPPTPLTDVVQISAGDHHALALRADGTVVAWGSNQFGESSVPADLPKAIGIAAGGEHSLAVLANGSVVALGRNDIGECNVPVGLTGVVQVAGGYVHSAALKSDGSVVGWGRNNEGQSAPVPASYGVKAISSGEYYNLLLVPVEQAPVFVVQPTSARAAVGGYAIFSTVVSGAPVPSLQWQVSTDSGGHWSDLTDGGMYSGTTTATLAISPVGTTMDGYRYRCIAVDSSAHTAISTAVVLTVTLNVGADFNLDGKPDLIWQNRNSGERGFWMMNGTAVGMYVKLTDESTEWEINGYGDFDGDGQTDLIWSNVATGERKLWLMDGAVKSSEVALATVGTEWEICGVADFNGDGKPDIVWQNTISGQRGMWLMNGAAVGTFTEFATVGTEWQICATGDFNGDGKPDIVWQNTISGERGMWLMNGTQVGTYIAFATVGTEWSIVGAADFNGDGKTDIVWQNAISGERGMWLMNGTQVGTYIAFATVGTEWSLGRMPYRRAAADFNADNQPDIIWSNTTTGERGFWIMNGLNVGTYMKFADVATQWRIAGSADFNADSKADIIWENTVTGERGFWIMNGTSVGTYMKFADVGTEWRIAGSADFNADSKPDIIWENTVTGERGFWIMNGTSVGTYMKFADVGTEWRIAGAADFNGDAKPDIIWENTVTGERGFWVMNGTTVGYYQSFATLSTDWQLKGAADFNHDGKPDIIRQNTVTGERGVWFMNGMTAGTYQPFATVGSEWTIGN